MQVLVLNKPKHKQTARVELATSAATSTSMSSASAVVCLGCGSITRRSSDRRNLNSVASQHVAALWKTTMTSELQKRKQLVDLDCLISGSDETSKPGKMCRKCFYAYEKVFNAKTVLQTNAAKALDAILPTRTGGLHECAKRSSDSSIVPPPKKRPLPPTFSPNPISERTQSPGVVVRQCIQTACVLATCLIFCTFTSIT